MNPRRGCRPRPLDRKGCIRQTRPMVPLDKLAQITQRFEFLEAQLHAGAAPAEIARISREYSDLKPVAEEIAAYRRALDDLAEAEAMLADPEMRALAEDEIPVLRARIPEMEQALRLALLPKDAADARPAILEIRPGTGGEEASLFAGDLARMYQRYAERMGWRFDVLESAASDLGGIKEFTAHIEGEGVYARLKYESGVHRVQRVPETEAQGRIHTSAATVAVMPEAEEVDVEIRPEDLRIDIYRASGAGGQHVNKTESAVRITHLPTNTVVTCQDERSQHKNKARAMKVLASRILAAERERYNSEISADRKSQVGSGDRSERIRTYNFPQGRCTDHRINLTLYSLERIMEGEIQPLVEALSTAAQAEALKAAATE